MSRVAVLIVMLVVLFAFRKPEPRPSIPATIIRKVIFGQDESSAVSASSSDDGAGASETTTHAPASSTFPSYPCTCRVCMCKGPDYPLSEEEFKRLQEDLKRLKTETNRAASTEFDLQTELVHLLSQVDELKKENEQLKQPRPVVYAATASCPTGTCAPARTTYGNYYQGSGYYYNNTRPARGLFRRW